MKKIGLTLIELLIVIGIILSLLGLVLGIVSIGKEAAMKTQCMNNLKQLYLASKMYEQTFGEPPIHYNHFLSWQPSYRSLLICPKDPFEGFAAGGWSPVDPSRPTYVPHSYLPQYWTAYWIVKGKIKILAPVEKVKEAREKAIKELIEGDYFICRYHWMAISVDGKIRPWGPPWRIGEQK